VPFPSVGEGRGARPYDQPRRVRRAVDCMHVSAKQPVVVGMGADPEPHQSVSCFDGERAVVSADPSGPEPTDLLEVERWMPRVLLQTGVGLIGEILHIRR
jgi:hypothetical protein